MNKIHQVIFNKSTQQFVVVSELAKSAGKPKAVSVGSVDIVSILQNFSEKRPLVDFSFSVSSQSHSSDLKIGQFSRVSSPIIDLIQSVEQAVNNKEASDRVRLAQALGTAAKAYSTAGDLANGGALFRVETGTGFSHSRERNETASRESVGNQLNAQHIDITSRSGDITATHTAFTSRDEQGKRLNDSSITFNSAKDLNLNAGQSEYRMKGRQQNSGFEAGTGVAVGAQTGWYFYAQAGFSNGKQDEYHLTHQNSQIDTETLNINTQGNTTLQGAVAKANRINADIKGNLTIESLQDIHQSESDSVGFGGRIQAAIGTAWGGSAYGNMASGESNSKQVIEQSGLFAEEGGYNVTANNVELIGGAIASQNPENSTLTTNTITFTDIQNESSSQAVSAGISASANLNKQAGTEAKTDEQAKQQAEIAKLTGTPQSNGINPSVPMFDSSQDNSTTKATLTEGTIILNKDTTPTQTTAKELGINTDLSQANRQVEQPKDINQVLKEQQILSQAAGNVAEAVMTYAENQKIELQQAEQKAREAAEQAAKSGDVATALAKLQEAERLKTEVERWESGGDNKRKATVVATALSLAVAGKPAEAIAAGAASPYINEAIKHITENTDNKVLEALNVPLHILWGAVEAELAGGSAKAGAIAAGVGEIGARVLAETVYGKQPNELNEEEKQNLLTTSKALAGIAVAGTGGSTGAETLANASVGMTVAENAVENNSFLIDRFRENKKAGAEQWKQEVRDKLGDNTASQIINGAINVLEEVSDSALFLSDTVVDTFAVLTTCAIGDSYCSQAKTDLAGKNQAVSNALNAVMTGEYWENIKIVAQQAYQGDQEALENFAGVLTGLVLPTKVLPNNPKLSDFSKSVSKGTNANEQLPVVGKSTGYENQVTDLKVSTGAENVALYPKLKDDLRSQQQAGFEKVIKDLNVKPQGSVLMLPDYRQKLAEAKSSLPPNLQGRGNSAIASINIDGLDTTILAGNSRINKPTGSFVGQGKTEFTSLRLPNKEGKFIDRRTDSEYKIFSNLADQLGSNTQAKGQVTIFTERPACPSCLGVAEQFNKRYPNIKVNIFDNNGNLIKP